MVTLKRYAKWLRLREVTQVSGFASAGCLFAIAQATPLELAQSVVFFAATFFAFSAVYSFNSYSGYDVDVQNARLAHVKENRKGLFAIATVAFLLPSLLLYALLDHRLVLLGSLVFLLWSVYSFPRIGLKHFPLTGSLVHVLSQILTFQMAFLLLAEISVYSWLVSFYFGFLFAGGHIHHELLDFEADREAGATTGAVFFGQKTALRVYAAVFLLSGLYWLALGLADVIRPWELVPFLSAPVLQLGTMVYLHLTSEVRFETLLVNRRLYRLYYFLGVAGYALLKLSSLLLRGV